MKYLIFLFLCCSLSIKIKAQHSNFEVKVIPNKFSTVRGHLQKVSAEGIGVRDYIGNYLIFRPNEIKKN